VACCLREGLRRHVGDDEQQERDVEACDEQELLEGRLSLRRLRAFLRGERIEPLCLWRQEGDSGEEGRGEPDEARDDPELTPSRGRP
jgi:hypothetical protein